MNPLNAAHPRALAMYQHDARETCSQGRRLADHTASACPRQVAG